jgi:hypothetical protein
LVLNLTVTYLIDRHHRQGVQTALDLTVAYLRNLGHRYWRRGRRRRRCRRVLLTTTSSGRGCARCCNLATSAGRSCLTGPGPISIVPTAGTARATWTTWTPASLGWTAAVVTGCKVLHSNAEDTLVRAAAGWWWRCWRGDGVCDCLPGNQKW